MKNFLSLILSITLLSPQLIAQTQANPDIDNGLRVITDFFTEKPLVAIGEVHAHAQLYDFLTPLITQEAFYTQVNDIVIEAANALYQPLLDRYIFGEDIALKELQKIWINTTQSPVDPWSHVNYFQLLKTVRELNNNIPLEHRIRVIAGDPAMDWGKVHTINDYESSRGNRNEFYANTVINEVLKKQRKALLIVGGAHLNNRNSPNAFINQRIESAFPNSLIFIQAPAGLGPSNKTLEEKIAHWPMGSISNIKDTWIGELPGFGRVLIPSTPNETGSPSPAPAPVTNTASLKKQDMYKYMLYFGSADQVLYAPIDTSHLQSDSIWQELNRRSIIRFNSELLPETRATGILRPISYN